MRIQFSGNHKHTDTSGHNLNHQVAKLRQGGMSEADIKAYLKEQEDLAAKAGNTNAGKPSHKKTTFASTHQWIG
ncbi:MAG: hypothetical protein U0003_00485 [Vampirovibrionales bacterium]